MWQAEESFPHTINTVGTGRLWSPLTALIKGRVPAVESSTEQHLYLFMSLVLFIIRLMQEFLKRIQLVSSLLLIIRCSFSSGLMYSCSFSHYLNVFWNDENQTVCLVITGKKWMSNFLSLSFSLSILNVKIARSSSWVSFPGSLNTDILGRWPVWPANPARLPHWSHLLN